MDSFTLITRTRVIYEPDRKAFITFLPVRFLYAPGQKHILPEDHLFSTKDFSFVAAFPSRRQVRLRVFSAFVLDRIKIGTSVELPLESMHDLEASSAIRSLPVKADGVE